MGDANQLAYQGNLEALKVLVDRDNRCLSREDDTGRTVLHWAASGGYTHVVEWLLVDKQVPVDPRDDSRWTPLIIASSAGHTEVAALLIGAGANVNACTDQGRSCLLYACSRNRSEIAKYLLENHADINLQDKLGAGPIHRAAACGHIKIVQLLLEYSNQLDFHSGDLVGNTPLHLACEEGAVEVARKVLLLLEAGADVRVQNKEEKTPIELARDEHVRALGELMMAREGINPESV